MLLLVVVGGRVVRGWWLKSSYNSLWVYFKRSLKCKEGSGTSSVCTWLCCNKPNWGSRWAEWAPENPWSMWKSSEHSQQKTSDVSGVLHHGCEGKYSEIISKARNILFCWFITLYKVLYVQHYISTSTHYSTLTNKCVVSTCRHRVAPLATLPSPIRFPLVEVKT